MTGRGALVIAALGLAGCGPTVREVVRTGIDESSQKANWDKLRAPARELAGEVTRGVLDAGASAELGAKLGDKLDASVDRFVRTFLRVASEELDTELSPAAARAVRASVDAAMAGILSDGTKRGVEDIANRLTAAAMVALARGLRDQLAPAVASALDNTLGPAMQRMIENHLGPALAATLKRDLAPALAELGSGLTDATRRTATAAAEGFVDGIRNRIGPRVDEEIDRLHAVIDKANQDAHSTLRFVGIAVLGAISGLLALALWLRHRTAVAARDALDLVTREIGRTPSEPILALAQRIKAAGEGSRAGAFLAEHLRARPSFKLKPPPLPWAADR